MNRKLKYFFLSFFLVAAYLILNPASVQAQVSVPSVSFIGVDHSPLVAGDTEKFTITSKGYSGKVQYRVFLLNQTSMQWTELTSNGYSEAIDTASPFILSYDTPFDIGKYTLKTYVKRYSQTGITKNAQCGDYDTVYTSYLNCVNRDDSNRVYANDDMIISEGRYIAGQPIKITGIKNISGMNGPYSYRLHIFSPDKVYFNTSGWSGDWKMNVTGTAYQDTIEWTPTEPGTYIIDLWAMSSDSTLWPLLKKNPSAKYYESWKLLKIKVEGDINTYSVNTETDLYNSIKDGLTRVAPKITLDASNTSLLSSTQKISEIVNKVLRDTPTLNCFDNYVIGYNYISFDYLYSRDKILEMRKQVDDKANEIIGSIINTSMSELQKEKAIHDYIVNNTEYDYDGYQNNSLTKEDYTAYGCLINKKAVCEGYDSAMWVLLNKVGIETIVVYGTANGSSHGWNIVKIGGKYYHVDATFDDPVIFINGVKSSTGTIEYTYFNKTDSEMSADHTWDRTQYPACN